MLTIKRSAGVTPEVNLREHISCMPLPSVNKAAHSGIETQGDVTISPKQGYQWPHKKVLQKFNKQQQQIGRDIIQVTFGKFVTSSVQKLKI